MRTLTRRVYLFQFAADFVPIYTLYSVMFAEDGLSTFEISVVIAAWSAASLLFEVPSGVLADRIDRRYVLVMSQVLTASGLLLWIIFPTFWSYLLGFIIWGIGGACYSGTFEALLYDELKSRGEEREYVNVTGRCEAISLIAVLLSAFIAAPVVNAGYDAVLYLSLAFAVGAAAIPLLLPKAEQVKEVEDEKYFAMLKRGIRESRKMPGFIQVLLVVALIGCAADVADEYGPLFVSDAGFAPNRVALIAGLVVLFSATASLFAGRIRLGFQWHPMALVIAGVAIAIGAATSGIGAAVAFGFGVVVLQSVRVLMQAHLQHTITGDLRATSTSMVGFTAETFNTVALLGLGAWADATSRSEMYGTFGAIAAALGVVCLAVLQWQSRFSDGSGARR